MINREVYRDGLVSSYRIYICMKVSLTLARNSVFFVIYNQKGKPSTIVTKFVFFHSFYNCCYDVLFYWSEEIHLYLLSYILTKFIWADAVKHLLQKKWGAKKNESHFLIGVAIGHYFKIEEALYIYILIWKT